MESCPNCNAKDLVRINLAPGGRALRFSTCRGCEHRWWVDHRDAGVLRLQDVLAAVAGA